MKRSTSIALAAMPIVLAATGLCSTLYNAKAQKDIVRMAHEKSYRPAIMEQADALRESKKKLEDCVLPDGMYKQPLDDWDDKTKRCMHEAENYQWLGGDLDKLKNSDAIKRFYESRDDYWTLFGEADPFIDPFAGSTGVAPYTTQQHMDAALEIMKRRDWLANSDITGRVIELLEESYNGYTECGRENLYGDRDERCTADAKQVRRNYTKLERALAAAGVGTHIPLTMLETLEAQ